MGLCIEVEGLGGWADHQLRRPPPNLQHAPGLQRTAAQRDELAGNISLLCSPCHATTLAAPALSKNVQLVPWRATRGGSPISNKEAYRPVSKNMCHRGHYDADASSLPQRGAWSHLGAWSQLVAYSTLGSPPRDPSHTAGASCGGGLPPLPSRRPAMSVCAGAR